MHWFHLFWIPQRIRHVILTQSHIHLNHKYKIAKNICVLSSNMNYKFLIFAFKICIGSQMHLQMMILSGYLSFYFSWGRHKILDYWTRWNKLLFYLELLSNKWLQAWMDEDRGQSHWVSIVGFSMLTSRKLFHKENSKYFHSQK